MYLSNKLSCSFNWHSNLENGFRKRDWEVFFFLRHWLWREVVAFFDGRTVSGQVCIILILDSVLGSQIYVKRVSSNDTTTVQVSHHWKLFVGGVHWNMHFMRRKKTLIETFFEMVENCPLLNIFQIQIAKVIIILWYNFCGEWLGWKCKQECQHKPLIAHVALKNENFAKQLRKLRKTKKYYNTLC